VDDVQLGSISYFEISALRNDLINVIDPTEDGSVTITPQYTLQTAHRDDDRGFRVRIRSDIETSVGTIKVDVAADYVLTNLHAAEISPGLMIEFVNEVAVMVLLPYLRQSIADVSQRVFGASLTMPIYKRGEVSFVEEASSVEPG